MHNGVAQLSVGAVAHICVGANSRKHLDAKPGEAPDTSRVWIEGAPFIPEFRTLGVTHGALIQKVRLTGA